MSVAAEEIANVLGGRRVLGRQIRSMRELDDMVREGMPKRALDYLIDALGELNYGEFAVQLRNKIVPRARGTRVFPS